MATATTAPVIPAVYFSSAASVFGIGPADGGAGTTTLITGADGGGLGTVTASTNGSILARSGDALAFTTTPTIAGLLTASSGISVTGAATVAGNLSTTSGGTFGAAGLITAAGGVTLTGGNLDLGSGRNLTVTSGAITVTSGSLTLSSGDATVSGTVAAGAMTIGGATVATQAFVQSHVSGLTPKAPVRLRTVAALAANSAAGNGAGKTLTSDTEAALEIDGVEVAEGDRILVDQNGVTAISGHAGIYTVTATGSVGANWVLTRATDADTGDKLAAGSYVFVTEGDTSADQGFLLTNNGLITVDTGSPTPIAFAKFSSIAATTPSGGTGTVQYQSDSSTFVGDSDFTYDATGDGLLTVNNIGSKTASGLQLGLGGISGSTSRVLVGTPQDSTAVAFGPSASTTAVRSIAIGAAAIARVVDSIMVPAIPIAQKYDGSSLGTAGNRGLASSISFLPSVVINFRVTGSTTVNIPAGAMFLPLGAAIWISSVTSPTDATVVFSAGITGATTAFVNNQSLTLSSSSVQGQMRSYGLSGTNPYAIATDVNIVYTIESAAAAGTAVTGRIALYGMYVERE